jgi:hypothetical protein
MPLFPNRKNSLYYILEIDIVSLLANFGYYNPTINFGSITGIVKFFATKFEVSQSGDIQPQLYIQGKPGFLAQSTVTPVYTYTIECPLLTNTIGSNFAPYNSLTFLALNWANWQWQIMQNAATKPTNFPAILESFEIDFSPSQATQIIKIVSNRLLTDYIQSEYVYDIIYNTGQNINYPKGSRLLKNYDCATDMIVFDGGVTFSVLQGSDQLLNVNYNIGLTTQTPVFIEKSTFKINFEYEKKYGLNSFSSISSGVYYSSPLVVGDVDGYIYPAVAFWLKNYNISQNFSIVGQEAVLSTENFYGGNFNLKSAQITMLILNDLTYASLYSYILPFMVKSKTEIIAAESLIKTNLDFSFNGAQYPADATLDFIGSPPISPYNLNNVLINSYFV